MKRENPLQMINQDRIQTLSPGVELKSPAKSIEGVHSNLSATKVLN